MGVPLGQCGCLLDEGLARALWLVAAEATDPQIDNRLPTGNWQIAKVTLVTAVERFRPGATAGQCAPAASQRTVRCMISSHSCTCSTTSPAPGGNSTCGSTVHPVGGPAIRQAGRFTGTNRRGATRAGKS